MNNFMIFGILLLPNLQSLLPILPAIGVMLFFALAMVIFGFSKPGTSALPAFRNLKLGSKLSLAVGAQILLLISFAVKYEVVIAHSKPIVLRTTTIDPFDPFRGNFMAFSYDIGQLQSPKVAFNNAAPLHAGEEVWVTLRPGNPAWQAVSLSDRLPNCAPGQAILKGIVQTNYANHVSVHYGLEQFFYPADKSIKSTRSSLALIAVNPDGEAVLTNLIPIPDP